MEAPLNEFEDESSDDGFPLKNGRPSRGRVAERMTPETLRRGLHRQEDGPGLFPSVNRDRRFLGLEGARTESIAWYVGGRRAGSGPARKLCWSPRRRLNHRQRDGRSTDRSRDHREARKMSRQAARGRGKASRHGAEDPQPGGWMTINTVAPGRQSPNRDDLSRQVCTASALIGLLGDYRVRRRDRGLVHRAEVQLEAEAPRRRPGGVSVGADQVSLPGPDARERDRDRVSEGRGACGSQQAQPDV